MISDYQLVSRLFREPESQRNSDWNTRDWLSEDMVSLLPAVREFSPDAFANNLLKKKVIYDTALPMISKKRHARLMTMKRLADEISKRDKSQRSFINLSVSYSNTRSKMVSEIANDVYVGTYRALFDMPFRRKNEGLWMILLLDSWISVDTTFSFSQNALSFVNEHPKIHFPKAISTDPATYTAFGSELLAIKAELEARIELLKQSAQQNLNAPLTVRNTAERVVIMLLSIVGALSAAYMAFREWEKAEAERKAREAAAAALEAEKKRIEEERKRQEEADAERFTNEMAGIADIEHSSDHVDHFDRNREKISSTA